MLFSLLLLLVNTADASGRGRCGSEVRVDAVSPAEQAETFLVTVTVTRETDGKQASHPGCFEGNTVEIEHRGEAPAVGDVGLFGWSYSSFAIDRPPWGVRNESMGATFYPPPERCVLEAVPGAKQDKDPTKTQGGLTAKTAASSPGCPGKGVFFTADLPPHALQGHRYRVEGIFGAWKLGDRVRGSGFRPASSADRSPDLHPVEALQPVSVAWRELPVGACVFGINVGAVSWTKQRVRFGGSKTLGCLHPDSLAAWPPPVLADLEDGTHWFRLEQGVSTPFPAP